MFANLPKFVFFTGKGGVGKTSLACATALALADAGKRVLVVSTDPASNVGQVFETKIGAGSPPFLAPSVSMPLKLIPRPRQPNIANVSSAQCAASYPGRR